MNTTRTTRERQVSASRETTIFSGSAGTVTLDSGISADEVSFQTDGYTLQDGTLATSGYGISVAAGMNATVNSAIDGSTGLIKIGTGNLILGGSNTYTGTTLILYGTPTVASSEAFGDSSEVTSRPSATLDLNGQSIDDSVTLEFFEGTLTNSSVDAATFAGPINYDPFGISPNFTVSGTGDITLSGAVDEYDWGALTKTGDNTLILSGSDNNIGLDLVVDSGIVQLDKSSSSSIHAVESSLTINGGTVQITGAGGDQIEKSSTVAVGGGTLDLNGNNETVDSFSGAGDILVTGSGVLTVSSTSTNVGTTTIDQRPPRSSSQPPLLRV